MPRTARSRSADGATIAALLPPSSSSSLPNRPATRGATARPIAGRAGGADQGHPRVVDERLADRRGPPSTSGGDRLGGADPAGRLGEQRLAGERGEQRLLRRLPHHRVAADERERGVPRPHRDREVERADDADHPERVPLLHHPVTGPLGGDRQAVAAGATARRRGRRCRSSPGPRRGPRSGSCPPRSRRARRGRPCARAAARRARGRARRGPAPGTVRHVRNASCAAADDRLGHLLGGVRGEPGQLAAGDGGAGDQVAVVPARSVTPSRVRIADASARRSRGTGRACRTAFADRQSPYVCPA